MKKTDQSHLNLTDDEIYYGLEANKHYMGVSQYKRFIDCEARALAEINGDWVRGTNSPALILGNYVHSYFESEATHKRFVEVNKDNIYSKRKPYGLLKAYEQADVMIKKLEEEPLFNYLWQGERETVVTGELFGVEWKGKIDLLNVEKGYFVDLKTTASIGNRFYNEKYGKYVSFVENYGYVLQMAVYEKLLSQQFGRSFTGYIYAISKQDIPEMVAIDIEQHKKEFELDLLGEGVGRVVAVKNGEEEPTACGKCDFCKTTRKLEGFITTDELIG